MRRVLITGSDGMCFCLPTLYLAYVMHKSEAAVRSAVKYGTRFCGYRIDYAEAK